MLSKLSILGLLALEKTSCSVLFMSRIILYAYQLDMIKNAEAVAPKANFDTLALMKRNFPPSSIFSVRFWSPVVFGQVAFDSL